MKKLLTLCAAVLASFSLWATDVTVDLALAKNTDPAPSIGSIIGDNYSNGSFDGTGYKIGSDGNSIGWSISSADKTFSAFSFTGYINSGKTDKNYGVAFSTDGGTTWGTEQQLANDGTKSVHAVDCSGLTVPDGANAVKIIRRAGTSTYVSSITLTLADVAPSTDPVASVTVDGPTAAYIGVPVTFTANTDVTANAYKWYVDGVEQNDETAKTFEFTPAAKGTYSIKAAAKNDNNTSGYVESTAHSLTVTKVCGMLIKATHTGATTASIDEASVIGGTVDKNTQGGGKLGSNGHYFGVKLASGNFMAGDVVTIVATELQGGNNATLYSDKGTTSLGSAAFDAETLTATVTLTQSAEWIYLYRVDGKICNPVMGYISVTRSCEDSDDATIHSLTVNGDEVAKDAEDNKYEYTVSASYEAATVEVAFDIHPLATASIDSPFNINVPEAGADANGQAITVTAEDGTQVTYTVFVSKSTSLNNDATLQALAVEGYTLAPAFDPAVTAYTITKAYEDALPAVSAVSATLNDANATLLGISYNETLTNEIDIQIMAEDGKTAGTYTITVNSADAVKNLSRVLFSNGFDAFIDNTEHTVKAFYLAGTEAPTATTITAGAGTAGELADGKITVTGADSKTVDYIVTLEAVTPNTTTVAEEAAAGAFDGTENWVKSGLYMSNAAGFATDKYVLRRGLRGSDAATDQRVIAGWVRAYFFVGNASKFEMAVTGNKPLKYAVDGGEYTEVNADNISIALGAGNHMIEIVTNQTSGDCNLSAPKLVERASDPTALDNTEAGMKAVKRIVNGQLLIEKNGVLYNAQGAVIR